MECAMSAIPIVATDVPLASALRSWLADSAFHDAWEAPLRDPALSPTEIFLRSANAAPGWVELAMTLRNRAVRLFGLKDVGSMRVAGGCPAAAYGRGERLGIFTVISADADELVLGIDDRHLDVRVSFSKPGGDRATRYVVATVVRVHNRLGWAYMALLGRIHPFVVRAMMRQARV
jgi:hypothetical protein